MEKYRAALALCLLAIIFSTSSLRAAYAESLAKAQMGKVLSPSGYQGLASKAGKVGSVRILARLNSSFRPLEDPRSPESIRQQGRISSTQKALASSLATLKPKKMHQYKFVPYVAMEVDRSALDALLRSPLVAGVHEDVPAKVSLDRSVPRISAPVVWNKGYKGEQTVVAVLDTGIDMDHPLLAGSVVSEACYSTDSPSYSITPTCPGGVTESTTAGSGRNCSLTGCDHGTHVAGIIAGRQGVSGSPGSGVAPAAGIIAIQVFSREGAAESCDGKSPCISSYMSDQIKALEHVYALRETFNIAAVNMSLGGGTHTSHCDLDPRKEIIDTLKAAGIATIVSTGNDSTCEAVDAPACISSAVSVGATDDADAAAGYSNSAGFMSLLAPGSSITSSVSGGSYQSFDGTSMATPHVAGAWALMRQAYPSATVDEILQAFTSTGLPVTDTVKCETVTKNRINVDDALNFLIPKPALAISAASKSVVVNHGGSGTATVTSSVSGGFNAPVSLTVTGVPGGVTVSFTPASIAAPGTGTFAVLFTAAPTAKPGIYPITITGSGGGLTSEIVIHLQLLSQNVLLEDGFETGEWGSALAEGTEAKWTLVDSGIDPVAQPHGGGIMASFNAYDAVTGAARLYRAGSIAIPVSVSSAVMTFWMHHDTDYENAEQVQVQISTDGSNWSDVGTPIPRYDGSTGWAKAAVDLTEFKGKEVHIGFLGTTDYGSNIYLDDVAVQVVPMDFTLTVTPSALTVTKGGTATTSVIATVSGAFNSAVELTAVRLPPGIEATFSPVAIASPGSGNSTCTVRVGSSVVPGEYAFYVVASGAGISKSFRVPVTVTETVSPPFTISAQPETVSVQRGSSGTIIVTTSGSGGFNSVVLLKAAGLPEGGTVSFSPASISAPGSGTATLTFHIPASAPKGSYLLTVFGSGGGIVMQAPVTLTVTDPPLFSVSGVGTFTSFAELYRSISEGSKAAAYAVDGLIPGSLSLDRAVELLLKGGYDTTFANVTGRSILNGPLKISKGKLVPVNLAVR